MKIGGRLFVYGMIFYFVVATVYWYMSKDPIGTTVLGLTGGLAFMIGFYSIFTANRIGALPEDSDHALIEHADSDYGFFSPHSWWPLGMGFGSFLIALGFVFAWWLLILGVLTLMYTIFGLLFEYYRGNFAH